MNNIYSKDKNIHIDILSLNNEFQRVWKEHQNKFKSRKNKIGMPLKFLVNKSHIEIELTESINDFRNISELKSKISILKINNSLINRIEK